MADLYSTFEEMARNEKEGQDFVIERCFRDPTVLIVAIHGGPIEKHTDFIAREIAGEDYSLYTLIGKRKSANKDHLRIRSERYRESRLDEMLSTADAVISVHGERDTEASYVMPGGLDHELRDRVAVSLGRAQFVIEDTPGHLRGIDEENICNRGATRRGVQLEISKKLRDALAADRELLDSFAEAIRSQLPPAHSGGT